MSDENPPKLRCVRIELDDANRFVKEYHRHNRPVVGHRFSVGCFDGERLCGVAIVGRPVARMICHRTVDEVLRVATDGTKNACSSLLSACARISQRMGVEKIRTMTLDDEPGTSLRAAGFLFDGISEGGTGWLNRPGRLIDRTDAKKRWVRTLNGPMPIPKTKSMMEVEHG